MRLVSPHACPLPKVLHVCDRNDRIEDLVVSDPVHGHGHRVTGQDLKEGEVCLDALAMGVYLIILRSNGNYTVRTQ